MGQEIAAADADVVYSSAPDYAAANAYYAAVKQRMARYGRAPDQLKIMPALIPIVGRTEAEARAKLDRLQALIDPLVGMARLYGLLGDLSGHDFDGPVPEPTGAKIRSMAYGWWEKATKEGLVHPPAVRRVRGRRGLPRDRHAGPAGGRDGALDGHRCRRRLQHHPHPPPRRDR